MSDNLCLRAYRKVFTKTGKDVVQNQYLGLWQTPSTVTWEVLKYPTFEKQLEAYCEWADSICETIGYRSVYKSHTQELQEEIQRLRAEEYKFIFCSIKTS